MVVDSLTGDVCRLSEKMCAVTSSHPKGLLRLPLPLGIVIILTVRSVEFKTADIFLRTVGIESYIYNVRVIKRD